MTANSIIDDTNRCPACGANNDCAIARGDTHCWCMAEPLADIAPASNVKASSNSAPPSTAASCYCRACLRELSPSHNSARADNACKADKFNPDK